MGWTDRLGLWLAGPRDGNGLAAVKPPSAAAALPALLHWAPSGRFPIQAVGTSYQRRALEKIALNPRDQAALVLCTATLVLEDDNGHDARAVSVAIEGQKVGYLAADFAPEFRSLLSGFGLGTVATTCDAVITNGLVTDEKEYAYSVELDISGAPSPRLPTHPKPERRDANPVLFRQADGSYTASIFLGPRVIDDMDRRLRVMSWTTAHWSTVNYYLANSHNAGLGHKLFSVPKDAHCRMFGEDGEPDAAIQSIDGRHARVCLTPKIIPTRSNAPEQPRTAALSEGRSTLPGILPTPKRFAVVAVETSGTNPSRHHILQVAALRVQSEGGKFEFETYWAYVKPMPGLRIGRRIEEASGITRQLLTSEGRPRDSVMQGLRDFIGNDPLVTHNAPFSLGFLRKNLADCGKRLSDDFECTRRLAQEQFPVMPDHELATLAGAFNCALPDVHDARHAATSCAAVYIAIKSILLGAALKFEVEVTWRGE